MYPTLDSKFFMCGVNNCHSEFDNEYLLNFHFKLKHNGKRKLIIFSKFERDNISFDNKNASKFLEFVEKFKNIELCNWISKFHSTVNSINEVVLVDEFVCCLKCQQNVNKKYEFKEIHCFQHLKLDFNIENFFVCLLCSNSSTNYYSLGRLSMEEHLQKYHNTHPLDYNQFYSDNRAQHIDVLNKMFRICFGENLETTYYTCATVKTSTVFGNLRKMNRRFIKCGKCETILGMKRNRILHCYQHLAREKFIRDLFQCLMCKEPKGFSNSRLVRDHLQSQHLIKYAKIDVHYVNNTDKYKEQIETMKQECFGQSLPFKKSYPNLINPKDYIKCLKCEEIVKNETSAKRDHTLKHVTIEHKLEWLYQCLTCNQFKSMELNNILDHSKGIHNNNEPIAGLHYIDRKVSLQAIIERGIDTCFEKINSEIFAKCLKCGVNISRSRNGSFKEHVLKHLKESSKICWMYECKLCSDTNKKGFRCLRREVLRNHVKRIHHVTPIERGKHYISQMAEHKDIIDKEILECFKI